MQNLLFIRNFIGQRAFFHSFKQENYYDILNVKKNSSSKEIRDAFVKLSKKFHPDVSPNVNQTAQFVKISEAYQILSKPKSRNAYDQDLLARGLSAIGTNSAAGRTFHRPWHVKPDYEPNPGPYYGIKGMPRVTNSKIAALLIGFGIFGAIFGFLSVKHSFTFNRQKVDERTAEISSYHATIRADAEKFGNAEQLRRMMDRMAKNER